MNCSNCFILLTNRTVICIMGKSSVHRDKIFVYCPGNRNSY